MMKRQFKKIAAIVALLLMGSLNYGFVECPSGDNSDPMYFPHESDCSKFYICSYGTAIQRTCPPGTVFNPMLNACDFDPDGSCGTGVGAGPYVEDYYNKTEIIYQFNGYVDTALKRFGITFTFTGGQSYKVTRC